MREGEKDWQLEGFKLTHMAVGQSHMNPGTGSTHCVLRRDALDSARSFSGLKKFPLHFQKKPFYRQKEKAARKFCFGLLHSKGALQ
jgi:hypothetical protein